MNKGLLGKVSLLSLISVAFVLMMILVLPAFSVSFTTTLSPTNVNASTTNQILNFTITNINATGNITNVNITLPTGFGFINASNITVGGTIFSNTTNIVSWTNTSAGGFIANGSTQYFYINVSVPSVASVAYNFNVSTLDNVGAYNSSNVTLTVNDTTYPTWSSPSNITPSSYSSSLSQFNITWTDNVGISTVLIEGNWSNANASMSNATYNGGIYNYSIVLPAGVWQWRSYANDTKGNVNASSLFVFTIANASNPVNLYLNATQNANKTYTYPQAINATATSAAGTVYLYRSNVEIVNGSSPQSEQVLLGNGTGTYAYIVNATGNANYSDNTSGIVYYAFVDKGTPNVATYIDGSPANETVTHPTSTTIKGNSSTTVTPPTFNLSVGSASLGSGSSVSQSVVMGVGTHNVIYDTSGNENWTSASSSTLYLIVSQNSSNPVALTINNSTAYSDQNVSITYGTSITANCSNSYSNSGSCLLYRNGTLVTSNTSETITLGVGTHTYKVNTTGNTNYSVNDTGETFYVTVSKSSNPVNLYLNATQNANKTYTYPQAINATATSAAGTVYLYRSNVEIVNGSSPQSEQVLLGNGTGTYAYIVNATGNANYTDNTSGIVYYAFVNKGTLTISISGSNVTYPTSVAFNGTRGGNTGDSDVNYTLWRNSSLVNSGNGTLGNLSDGVIGVGWHIYTYNATGGENWTANSTGLTRNINVSKGTLSLSLSVSGVTYPNNVTATITASNLGASDVNYTLYRNTSLVKFSTTNGTAPAGETVLLGAGSYIYILNATPATFANWTANATGVNSTVTVNKTTPTLNLLINGASSDVSVTYGIATNVTPYENNDGDADVNYTLYKNGVVSATNNTAETLAEGAYVYIYNSTTGTNYTSTNVSWTLTVTAAGFTPSSGGGGPVITSSATRVAETKGNANITVPSIAASKMANVTIAKVEDVDFRQVNISVANSVNNIKIVITKIPNEPASVTHTIEGKVYHYIQVDKTNFTDSDLSKVYIKFAVNKSWLTANGVDKTNISLYRWVSDKWTELVTSFISNDSYEVFYQAESPGFSYFLIGTKGGETIVTPPTPTCTESWTCTEWSACINGKQTKACTDANNCGTTVSKPAESQDCVVQQGETLPAVDYSWAYTVAAIILIIVAAVMFVFRNKIAPAFSKISKKE